MSHSKEKLSYSRVLREFSLGGRLWQSRATRFEFVGIKQERGGLVDGNRKGEMVQQREGVWFH
jgi:hypothetical protein